MEQTELILHRKEVAGGLIVEVRIWRIAEADAERPHGFKYSLHCCTEDGEMIVRYDNERGKGDHRHIGQHEEAYLFVSLEKLIEDFWRDVRSRT